MFEKYTLITSNARYFVEKAGRLWNFKIGVIRQVIICFGEFQVIKSRRWFKPDVDPTVGRQEAEIGKHIRNRSCKGQSFFYVPEDLLRPYINNQEVPLNFWNVTVKDAAKKSEPVQQIEKGFLKAA